MRKYLCVLPVLVLVGVFLPTPAWAHNNPQPDSDAIYTGYSPLGDSSCTICHGTGKTGSVKLVFNGSSSAATYAPGATIPIQITVTDTGSPTRQVWGFELATRFTNGKQAGTLAATNVGCPASDSNCTHTLTNIFGQSGITVITHNNAVNQPGTTFTFTVNWTAPAAGSGQVLFTAAGNAGSGNTNDQNTDHIYLTEVALTAGSSTPPPTVPSNGVVDGAGFSAKISAGGIGSIFGSNMAAATLSASFLPLPTTLGATSVTMNGIKCGLFFISSGQINFQVPWELQTAPTASLIVTAEGGPSTAITIPISSASPGIFTIGGVTGAPNQGAVQIANTSTFVAPVGSISGVTSSPGTAGQFITIYVSGLGQVSPTPADGAAAGTGSSLSVVSGPVSVTIGTVNIPSTTPGFFAGLSPGFVGLYQVNVPIPGGLGTNSAVPVVVTAANLPSNTATIAVK
jgi:uncharacterized protein (TIGR03437 family)